VFLGCNLRNSDPLLVVKCDNRGLTAQLDEEPEAFLCKYTSNSESLMKALKRTRCIEVCANFFKSLGYTIATPAFVGGRSETQYLFDLLILGRVGWVGPQNMMAIKSELRKDNGETVVDVLISSKLININEMMRFCGMTNDIDCGSLILSFRV
jgi:hypothetical protein